MTLFFVGGASGSGKTAAIKELRSLVHDKIDLYDFDDIGIPETANTQWRQERYFLSFFLTQLFIRFFKSAFCHLSKFPIHAFNSPCPHKENSQNA